MNCCRPSGENSSCVFPTVNCLVTLALGNSALFMVKCTVIQGGRVSHAQTPVDQAPPDSIHLPIGVSQAAHRACEGQTAFIPQRTSYSTSSASTACSRPWATASSTSRGTRAQCCACASPCCCSCCSTSPSSSATPPQHTSGGQAHLHAAAQQAGHTRWATPAGSSESSHSWLPAFHPPLLPNHATLRAPAS